MLKSHRCLSTSCARQQAPDPWVASLAARLDMRLARLCCTLASVAAVGAYRPTRSLPATGRQRGARVTRSNALGLTLDGGRLFYLDTAVYQRLVCTCTVLTCTKLVCLNLVQLYWVARNSGKFTDARVFYGRTRTNFDLWFAIAPVIGSGAFETVVTVGSVKAIVCTD